MIFSFVALEFAVLFVTICALRPGPFARGPFAPLAFEVKLDTIFAKFCEKTFP